MGSLFEPFVEVGYYVRVLCDVALDREVRVLRGAGFGGVDARCWVSPERNHYVRDFLSGLYRDLIVVSSALPYPFEVILQVSVV